MMDPSMSSQSWQCLEFRLAGPVDQLPLKVASAGQPEARAAAG